MVADAICPRNLTALAATDDQQGDLLLYLDEQAVTGSKEEQKFCARLEKDLSSYKWDGLRDHSDVAIDDSLWQRLSTDKANCGTPLPLVSRMPVLCGATRNRAGRCGGGEPCAGDGGNGE